MRFVTAAALDLAGVAVFVAIGRASHDEPASLSGAATTAWPFLCGLVAGWLVTRAWRAPAAPVRTGVGVWLVTVAAGMALRAISGQGAAAAFIVVALAFVGFVTVGWRLVAALARRRRAYGGI